MGVCRTSRYRSNSAGNRKSISSRSSVFNLLKHAFLCPHMEIKVVYFTSVMHKTVLNPNIFFIDVRQPKPELWAKGRKIAI